MLRTLPLLAMTLALGACSDDDETLGPGDKPDTGVMETPDSGDPVDAAVVVTDSGVVQGGDEVFTMELGTVMTGANGETPPLTFELPSDVVSFMVVIAGETDTLNIIKKLDGPEGNLVSDDPSNVTQLEMFLLGPFAAQFKGPNRVVQDTGLAAALFPNNPAVTVSGGTYTMILTGLTLMGQSGVPYEGPLDVTIHYRTKVVSTGRLDVSLYFSGAGDITAATAPDDPLIQGALEKLGTIYAQANLTLGAVNYYDIDQRFRSIAISLDGSAGLLEEMFTQSEGKGPGLHYFIVDRFEGGLPGGMIAGIAGGLPGPPLSVGTTNSGVAVALAPAAGDPQIIAHVMAHEGGHWLGLFHTSEFIGTLDQMPDTPEGMAGDMFLMYPAVGGGTMISPSQAEVLRNHIETVGN